MKKSISILALLISFITLSQAQEVKKTVDAAAGKQTTQVAAANPNAPEISFTKTVHDYGTLFQGGDGHSEFEFTNIGKEPLILSSVKSSCGCTVPSWPREPIMPGKKEVIKVKYDTNRLGPINKTITVMSNAKTSPVVLKITGSIVKKAQEQTVPEKTLSSGASPTAK